MNRNSTGAQPSSVNDGDSGVSVCFEGLSYSIKTGDKENPSFTILDNISGAFAPGKMTALMGFDTLVGELTVESMLRYTAELKLPSSISAVDRESRVNEVIRMLDLESCRKTVIGSTLQRGISGGQSKRVNIGLALLQRPPILFLDEPTSGLDSRVADEVVSMLQGVALSSNRTIVCTIHSPTGHAFSCFNDLYMIHKGQTIYDGPVDKVQAYFQSTGFQRNPQASLPEWLVDLTSDLESIHQRKLNADPSLGDGRLSRTETRSSSFAELFHSSAVKEEADRARKVLVDSLKATKDGANKTILPRAPSELSKLMTLLKYRMCAHYVDAEFLGTRFGDKIIYALLILSLYFGLGEQRDPQSITSISSLLFFISTLYGFGASAFVPTLNLERKLFYRELADGCYSPTTYYFSKFIEEAVIAVFTSALFSIVVFFGLKLSGNFGIFFVNYYLTTLIGVMLAYFFSAAVPSLEAANALLPTYVTICIYFGGLFIVFDKIPKGWVWFSWTSFLRYSWGAFMVDNYANTELATVPVFFDSDGNPQTVLEFYGFSEGPIMNNVGACLGLLATLLMIFSVLGVLALVYIRHEKR
ncbi:multidrug ABC transporter ATPase [Nitzschia inconspicua]|uniref:Multidrug ABC transporter ATPase n=1 Tax=Nitzschia inconspicua TaxID=303405 RepID=A0A9K3LJJ0_9STRA|nr:multidrug ABC transporter ATPase [Nitzschia inconspicua]